MAYTPPNNARATGYLVTAANWNELASDILESAVAKVTTAGDLVYATAANALTRLGIGTARQGLQVNAGATAPTWAPTPASVLTGTGDLLYSSAANTIARLGIGTANYALQVNAAGTLPAWAPSATSVLTTQGDLLYASAANTLARLGAGTARQSLQMNAAGTLPAWAASPASVMTGTGDLLYSSSANTIARLAVGTARQILQTNSGATAPEWSSSISLTGAISGSEITGTASTGASATYTSPATTGSNLSTILASLRYVAGTDGNTHTGNWLPEADGTRDHGASGTRWRVGYYSSAIAIGTTPATVGAVRLANDLSIYARNAGNSADLQLLRLDSNNRAVLGGDVPVHAPNRLYVGDTYSDPGANNLKVQGQTLATYDGIPGFTHTPATGTSAAGYKVGTTGGNSYFGKDNSAGTAFGAGAYYTVVYTDGSVGHIMLMPGGAKTLTLYTSKGGYLGDTPSDPGANNLQVQGAIRFGGSATYATIDFNSGTSPATARISYPWHMLDRAYVGSGAWSDPGADNLLAKGKVTSGGGGILGAVGSAAVYPSADNTAGCGASGSRFNAVWAANGTIQTSSIQEKRAVARLSGADALAAVRGIDWLTYVYEQGARQPGESQEHYAERLHGPLANRVHAGYAAEVAYARPATRILSPDGQTVSPQTTASVVGAAVQWLADLLDSLTGRVAALEAA